MIKSKKYTGIYINKLKNGDKAYYAIFKLNGKTKKVKIGLHSHGVREAFAFNKRNELLNDTPLRRELLRDKDYINIIAEQFYKSKEKINRDNKNAKSTYFKHIGSLLKDKTIQEITTKDVEDIKNTLLDSELALATINNTLSQLSSVYNYGVLLGKCTKGAISIKKLKVNNQRRRYLERDEIDLLLNESRKISDDLYFFVLLALGTGARKTALHSIKMKDINFTQKTVQLEDLKGGDHYVGFLSDKIISLIDSNKKSDDFVISLGVYAARKDLEPLLNRLFNKGITDRRDKVVIHTFRHTFASHLAIANVPILTIKKLMNHKVIEMTLRYAHLSKDSGKEAVRSLYERA